MDLSPVTALARQAPSAEEAEPSLRRQEVLDVVERVFLREGLAPVRVGRLAAEAHCSRRTLYELAPSKEELFLLSLDRLLRRMARRGRDAIAGEKDPIARIVALGTEAAQGIGTLTPAFMQSIQHHPPARQLFERHLAIARAALEELINDAIDHGRLRPVSPSIAAEAVLVLVLHFTDPEYVRATGASPATTLGLMFDVFLAGAQTHS